MPVVRLLCLSQSDSPNSTPSVIACREAHIHRYRQRTFKKPSRIRSIERKIPSHMEDLDPEPLLPPLRSEMMPKSSSIRTLSLPPARFKRFPLTYAHQKPCVDFILWCDWRERERKRGEGSPYSVHSFIPLLSPLFPSMPAMAVAV